MKCWKCKRETVKKISYFYRWGVEAPEVLYDGPWCEYCKCYVYFLSSDTETDMPLAERNEMKLADRIKEGENPIIILAREVKEEERIKFCCS